MTTKEAQRAADAAWRKRLKESGGAHISVAVSAAALQALNALTGGDNRKRSETVNAALIAAAKAAQKPTPGLWGLLSDEQKAAALNFEGDDTHPALETAEGRRATSKPSKTPKTPEKGSSGAASQTAGPSSALASLPVGQQPFKPRLKGAKK